MAASGLGLEKLLVGAGWAISLLLCTNGLRKQSSRLVGPPFLAVSDGRQRAVTIECPLRVGVVKVTNV